LLGQCMFDAGNDLGPGTAYGKSGWIKYCTTWHFWRKKRTEWIGNHYFNAQYFSFVICNFFPSNTGSTLPWRVKSSGLRQSKIIKLGLNANGLNLLIWTVTLFLAFKAQLPLWIQEWFDKEFVILLSHSLGHTGNCFRKVFVLILYILLRWFTCGMW
jgi:hypothetical protein